MKKFKAIAATTKPDLNGLVMTVENLKAFENHLAPVIVNYDMCNEVGRVEKAYIEDDKLIVEGEVEELILLANPYPSIGVSFAAEFTDKDLSEFKITKPSYYGLVSDPSDTGTKPLEVIE